MADGALRGRGMGGKAGRGQLAGALTKHGLDSLDRLRPGHGTRAVAAVTNLQYGDRGVTCQIITMVSQASPDLRSPGWWEDP